MDKCSSGKRSYHTQELAEDALLGAQTAYNFPEGQGPINVYLCADCRQYHLTSKGPMNEKLVQYIAEGKRKLNKEANHWASRFKK